MTQATLPTASGEYANGQPAQGTEVRADLEYLRDFINGGNFDATDNIKLTGVFPWTNRHSWTISDANNDNLSLVVSAVMASSKYGLKISSSVAQVNSALIYAQLSNASSTVPTLEFSDAGSGSTIKVTKSGNGHCAEFTQSGTSNSEPPVFINQAGTGVLLEGELRGLTGLNGTVLAKTLTSPITADNTATETTITGLTTALPANFLQIGTTIRGRFRGKIDTPGAGPATARVRIYYGATTLLDSGAFAVTTSLANSLIECDFDLTCLTTGATGTIEAQGKVLWNSNTAPAARGLGTAGTGATNAAAITIDTTALTNLTATFTWGSAVAGCTAVIRSGHIEILK